MWLLLQLPSVRNTPQPPALAVRHLPVTLRLPHIVSTLSGVSLLLCTAFCNKTRLPSEMAGVRQTVNELTRTNHGTIYAPSVFYVQGGPTIR